MKKSKILAAVVAASAAPAAFAEGYTVPTEVTTAVTSLEGAATAYAGVILPYIVAVGLAFIGIAVLYLLFKVFKRFVGGK